MSVGGLSSRIVLKNCLFFHLILCLDMLSAAPYAPSTYRGMIPLALLLCTIGMPLSLASSHYVVYLALCPSMARSVGIFWPLVQSSSLRCAALPVSRLPPPLSPPCRLHLVHHVRHFVLSLVTCRPNGFVVGLFIRLLPIWAVSDRFTHCHSLISNCISYHHMIRASSCFLVDFPAQD